jgi:PAS domain S-box-containing protein
MRSGLRLVCAASFFAALLRFWPLNALLGQTPPVPKRILEVHWEDKTDAAEAFDRSLQEALRSAASGPVEFYSEFLDATRFPGEEQSQALAAFLRHKYASRKMDVVITDMPPPLDFLFKYRSNLFSDTPIVFATTQRPSEAQLAAGAGATGIMFSRYRKTVELALRLHPASEHVFIVSNSLPTGPSWERLVRADLEGFQSRADITYLTDFRLEELTARLKTLPRRSVVLYVWQRAVNRQGVLLNTHDLLSFLAPSVPAPIYGLSYLNVGRGIVGGYVWTRETRAAKLAEMALKVANGIRPADVPIENSPLVPMFDWRQLQRWGIAEDDLPPNSIIRYRQLTMWQQYKWRIAGALGVVVLQAVLIGALLILRRRAHRRAAALAEAQRVLQESEERFRRVFDEGPLGVALVGKDHRFLKVNDALCRMVGYDHAELVGMSFVDITHPDDARADVELAERLFKREIPFFRMQKRYTKKTGEIIWINLTASTILGPDG